MEDSVDSDKTDGLEKRGREELLKQLLERMRQKERRDKDGRKREVAQEETHGLGEQGSNNSRLS